MRFSTIFRYQLGIRDAIEEVARSKSAIWTGMILVLITTIPRNYDQMHFTEAPLPWLFGSLIFSLLSGYLVYSIGYRAAILQSTELNGKELFGWDSFMGLFLMTAPIAWLYAIPVERWMGSLAATKANLMLLGIVSVWRVLLMTRALAVTTGIPFARILPWVLFAALFEVGCLSVLGGLLVALDSMSGVRNSPEEELMLSVAKSAGMISLCALPFVIGVSLRWGRHRGARLLPERQPDLIPAKGLLAVAVVWILVAIGPQIEQAHYRDLEHLIDTGKYQEAVQLMGTLGKDAFAPSRTIAPLPSADSNFDDVPALVCEAGPEAPQWVQEHLLQSLDGMLQQYDRWHSGRLSADEMAAHIRSRGPQAALLHKMLTSLQKTDAGQDWLARNQFFLQAVHLAAENALNDQGHPRADSKSPGKPQWSDVLALVQSQFGTTNAPPKESTGTKGQ